MTLTYSGNLLLWKGSEAPFSLVASGATLQFSEGSNSASFLVEAIHHSNAPRDDSIVAEYKSGSHSCKDEVKVTAVQVDILSCGQVVSDTTQNTCVGVRADLEIQVKPTQTTGARMWAVEGMIVDDYKTDKNKGEVVAVRPIRYRQPKLEFYWVEGGMNRVTITLNISDTMSCSAEATFNVLEPNIMLMATAPGAVTDDVTRYRDIEGNLFRDRTKLPNGRFLHIGDGFAFDAEGNPIGTPGVLFNIQTFEPPADCDGELVWFQIVESSTRAFRKNNPSLSEVRTASGHDRSFPFSNTNSTKRIAIDSPGDVLASKRELTANGLNARSTIGVAINDSFTMYIGFKPKQHLCDGRISKSIIVPIKKVEWKWCGRATRNGGDPNNWTVSGTSEMGSVQDVGGMLPTWTKNVENATTTRKPNLGEFQECPDEPL